MQALKRFKILTIGKVTAEKNVNSKNEIDWKQVTTMKTLITLITQTKHTKSIKEIENMVLLALLALCR